MPKNEANSRQIKNGAVKGRHIGLAEVDGTHLKPGIITSAHLTPESVDGTHVAPKSITEAHLDIDWVKKSSEILQSKLIVDYVQTIPTLVSGASSIVTPVISAPVANDATEKGVVVDPAKNQVILRAGHDATQPLRDVDGEEVKARIIHDGTDFVLHFITNKNGLEVSYTFETETSILFQYPQRFDFASVSEMFGANEKFVDYGVDVSTSFQIRQLVADIFVDGYVLGTDGLPVRDTPLESIVLANSTDIETLENDMLEFVEKQAEVDLAMQVLSGRLEVLDQTGGSIDMLFKRMGDVEPVVQQHTTDLKVLNKQSGEFVDRISALENKPVRMKRIDKKFTDTDITGDISIYGFEIAAEDLPFTGDFDVYYNGSLLVAGLHYTESVIDDRVTGIEFLSRLILVDDIIQVRWLA